MIDTPLTDLPEQHRVRTDRDRRGHNNPDVGDKRACRYEWAGRRQWPANAELPGPDTKTRDGRSSRAKLGPLQGAPRPCVRSTIGRRCRERAELMPPAMMIVRWPGIDGGAH